MALRAQGKGRNKGAGSRSRRSELDGVPSALLPGGADGSGGSAFLEEEEEEEIFEDTETALYRKYGLRSHWNIAAFLPEAAREFFLAVVGDVLVQYHVRWRNLDSERHGKLDQLYSLGSSVSELLQEEGQASGAATGKGMVVDGVPLDDDAIESVLVGQMRTYCEKRYHRTSTPSTSSTHRAVTLETNPNPHTHPITTITTTIANNPLTKTAQSATIIAFTSLQKKLLEFISELGDVFAGLAAGEDPFPQRAGSHLKSTNPLLEFVKAVTHVLSLDGTLGEDVASLRRMLLREIKVREFDDDAHFKDPCLSYVLPDVICSYCQTCRDIDLLRDEALTAPLADGASASARWKCPICKDRMDVEEIENR